MKHVGAVALLLTIAGAPVTTLACVGWCVPDAMPVSTSCHHHLSSAGASIKDVDDTCARLLVASPFLREDPQPIRTAMPAGTPYALLGVPGETPLVSEHDVALLLPHRATSSLVLRL